MHCEPVWLLALQPGRLDLPVPREAARPESTNRVNILSFCQVKRKLEIKV